MEQVIESGLFLRIAGQGAGPPLLFIHGLGESGLCFEEILEHPGLGGRRCLAPDLPGYGRSPWAPEPLTLGEQARRLVAWLRARGTSEVVALGHSMGGVVALLLAEEAPELVTAVIDVDGNKAEADCAYSGKAAPQPLSTFLGEGFASFRDEVYRRGQDDRAHRGYYVGLRLADPRAFHRDSVELVELSRGEGLAERLAALPMPKRYLAGAPGGASPRALELLEAAGVALRSIAPSGHWPFLDQPDAFAREVASFLEEL